MMHVSTGAISHVPDGQQKRETEEELACTPNRGAHRGHVEDRWSHRGFISKNILCALRRQRYPPSPPSLQRAGMYGSIFLSSLLTTCQYLLF